MDDIANELAISKKTIYNFFENKTELVDATANNLHKQLVTGISNIRESSVDPFNEFFEVKDLVMEHLHDQKNHSVFQLEKFYPNNPERKDIPGWEIGLFPKKYLI